MFLPGQAGEKKGSCGRVGVAEVPGRVNFGQCSCVRTFFCRTCGVAQPCGSREVQQELRVPAGGFTCTVVKF